VNVRYPRDLRGDRETIGRVLVMTPSGAQVPLEQLADIRTVTGPSMIRNENGLLVGYVYVDVAGRDVGGYVEDARRAVANAVKLPPGYSLEWSGQYENMRRVAQRLKIVAPFTVFLIVLLLFANTRSAAKTLIVVLAVPFSLVGAVWLLWALGYDVSIAVWVGVIALMGLDAETGVFMLLFLDLAYDEAKANGRLRSMADLHEAVVHGAVKRLRPKMMTVTAAMAGLMPIMWSMGTGADVMKRVAAPMVGGARHLLPPRVARLPADLPPLEVARRGEEGRAGDQRLGGVAVISAGWPRAGASPPRTPPRASPHRHGRGRRWPAPRSPRRPRPGSRARIPGRPARAPCTLAI
jgi:Cu(I)/Ag(I) efflux system membrane protein CusA/SilA